MNGFSFHGLFDSLQAMNASGFLNGLDSNSFRFGPEHVPLHGFGSITLQSGVRYSRLDSLTRVKMFFRKIRHLAPRSSGRVSRRLWRIETPSIKQQLQRQGPVVRIQGVTAR